MGFLRFIVKAILFVLMSLTAYLLLAVLRLFGAKGLRDIIKQRTYQTCLALTGVHYKTHGEPVEGPALLVANHCSYIDVILLGACGDMCFTPKSDVKRWPLIGPLVSQFDVAYVDRTPGKTKAMQQALQDRLHAGARICVFPEATTSDGMHLIPFKSSLFSLAEAWEGEEPLTVQPVSIRYLSVDGEEMNTYNWPFIAWYGDVDLVPHLRGFFSRKRVEVEIYFHPITALQKDETRKELSERTEQTVRSKLDIERFAKSEEEELHDVAVG